jgi:hypothetical protein
MRHDRHRPASREHPRACRRSPATARGTGELAALEQHLAAEGPPAGPAPLLLLAGEPGIGTSRLLREATVRAPQRGWTVLEGGCQRRGGQEPYAPLLQALEHHIARQSRAQQQDGLHDCAWLVRLLPELEGIVREPSPAGTLPPEQERRLMFAAVARPPPVPLGAGTLAPGRGGLGGGVSLPGGVHGHSPPHRRPSGAPAGAGHTCRAGPAARTAGGGPRTPRSAARPPPGWRNGT